MLKITPSKSSITISQTTPKQHIAFHGRNEKLEDIVLISEKITDQSKAKQSLKSNNPKLNK